VLGGFYLLLLFPITYVDRRLSICDIEHGDEGLQSPVSQHVTWGVVVVVEPSGDDGRAHVHIHPNFPQPIDSQLPGVCVVRIGSV
jgi:hypothetical protein